MAILTLNPMFSEIRGSVKSLTFKRHGKGAIACGRPLIPAGRTSLQSRHRDRFSNISNAWKEMPEWMRVGFRDYATHFTSARKFMMARAMDGQTGTPNNFDLMPANFSVGGKVLGYSATSTIPGQIDMVWTPWTLDYDKFFTYAYIVRGDWFFPSTPTPALMFDGAWSLYGLTSGWKYRIHRFSYSVEQDMFSMSNWKDTTVA